jgi:hypothetical protein
MVPPVPLARWHQQRRDVDQPAHADLQWQDYAGTTPVEEPGTVADSSNPVGLALDIRAGATVLTDPGNHMLQSTSAARPLMSAYDGQTLGPGDTYDGTGYPVCQLYDGVDDGMATAAFPAGTLIDGMDCMIAVRRDSAAACVAGLYNWMRDQVLWRGINRDSGLAIQALGLPPFGLINPSSGWDGSDGSCLHAH